MKFVCLSLLIFFFADCNNATNNKSSTGKTRADTLMDEVMQYHNDGMAAMSKIDDRGKKMQLILDSLATRPVAGQNSKNYQTRIDSALQNLKRANDAMENWMDQFNMDSFSNNLNERAKYLESEKLKISAVKDSMINSLRVADSLLVKK